VAGQGSHQVKAQIKSKKQKDPKCPPVGVTTIQHTPGITGIKQVYEVIVKKIYEIMAYISVFPRISPGIASQPAQNYCPPC